MVGCQIVIAHVFSYSVSVFQFPSQFSPSFCSVFLEGADWTEFSPRARDSALPGLLHLHCRIVCTCTAGLSAPALPGYLHLHCVLELSNKDCLLTRNWILCFCTVTDTPHKYTTYRRYTTQIHHLQKIHHTNTPLTEDTPHKYTTYRR